MCWHQKNDMIEEKSPYIEILDKGTSINDVPRFLTIFDLPTYLSLILSYFDKATYLMTFQFDWPLSILKIFLLY